MFVAFLFMGDFGSVNVFNKDISQPQKRILLKYEADILFVCIYLNLLLSRHAVWFTKNWRALILRNVTCLL